MPRDPREPTSPMPQLPSDSGSEREADCGCAQPRTPLPTSAGAGSMDLREPPPTVGTGDPSSIEDDGGCADPDRDDASSGCDELVRRRSFDFTNLAASSSIEVVLERAVPTIGFADALLQVRVHAATIPSGASLVCIASATSPTPEEPGTDFVDPNPVGQVTIDSTVTAPSLRQAQLGAGFGRAVRVALRATRGATGGTFTATLSACLVLKVHPGEPAQMRMLTTHSYDDTSFALRFIPFAGTTAGASLSTATNQLAMIAPYDGWLRRVTVRSTASAGAGSTVVTLHRNYSGTASATRTVTVPLNVSTVFEFGADASFLAGEALSIGIDPTAGPTDVTVVCEWVYRRG